MQQGYDKRVVAVVNDTLSSVQYPFGRLIEVVAVVKTALSTIAKDSRKDPGYQQFLKSISEQIFGKRRAGKRPFGYSIIETKEGQILIENAEEQEAIDLILELRQSGSTLKEIKEILEGTGIRTATGNEHWQTTVIRRICLCNNVIADCRRNGK